MPINIIKNTFDYCSENKLFFIFVLCLLFGLQFVFGFFVFGAWGSVIMNVILMGYGLQISQDIIHGGTRLPKLLPKKIIIYGVKGTVIVGFYVLVQIILLNVVSLYSNFPIFNIEDVILEFNKYFYLFLAHDPVSCIVFVVLGLIIVYVTTFFMELALARLADGGRLLNAFNFPRIKHAIDVIGWRDYARSYTRIILSIVFLTFLMDYQIPVFLVDCIVDAILSFLIFIIEFVGIGTVYKVYKINNLNN